LLTDGAKPAPQQPDQDAAEPPPDEDAEPRDMSATLAALAEFMKPSETIATREAAIRDSAKIMVQDAYHRVISRETTALSRASTKEPKEFFKWVDEFYDEHQPIVADALRRPVQAYFTACGQFTDVETVVSDLAYEHVRESRETVLKQTELQPSEWGTLPERFRALTDSWKKTRVDKCLTVLTTK
jgi:predicted ATPase